MTYESITDSSTSCRHVRVEIHVKKGLELDIVIHTSESRQWQCTMKLDQIFSGFKCRIHAPLKARFPNVQSRERN